MFQQINGITTNLIFSKYCDFCNTAIFGGVAAGIYCQWCLTWACDDCDGCDHYEHHRIRKTMALDVYDTNFTVITTVRDYQLLHNQKNQVFIYNAYIRTLDLVPDGETDIDLVLTRIGFN